MSLFIVDPREAADDELAALARSWLTAEECSLVDRIVVEGRRREALVTRVLARFVLGRRLGIEPAALRFVLEPLGRPRLADGALRFNSSNTDAMVVCAVSPDEREVGVDVEAGARADAIARVARLVFQPGEIAAIACLDRSERARARVELWTSKESYMKARGLGFALPPLSFAVAEIRGWNLSVRWFDGHAIALAVEGSAITDLETTRLTLREIVSPRRA